MTVGWFVDIMTALNADQLYLYLPSSAWLDLRAGRGKELASKLVFTYHKLGKADNLPISSCNFIVG